MPNVIERTPEGLSILIATKEHAKELTKGLRDMDKLECVAVGADPSTAVESSMASSDMSFTVKTKDDKVVGSGFGLWRVIMVRYRIGYMRITLCVLSGSNGAALSSASPRASKENYSGNLK